MSEEERMVPQSDIELQLLFTDPKWGQDVPQELKDKLTHIISSKLAKDENGNLVVIDEAESLWELLSFYTRDVRLGNLTVWNGELECCRYSLESAGIYLRAGHKKAFMAAISHAISILEVSQSKGGFLRIRAGTITKEDFKGEIEPKKRGLIGTKSKE
jgi:hypothetical protein